LIADRFRRLGDLYESGHPPVVRNGLCYPVTILPATVRTVNEMISYSNNEAVVDAELLRSGARHRIDLQELHRMHNGVVAVLMAIRDGTIYAVRSSYFDMISTCDSLRTEYLKGSSDLPMRARAHLVAGTEGPIRSGRGRAAAIGVSVAVTLRRGRRRQFLLGRRRLDLAMDGDAWQLAPSGMVEASPSPTLLVRSVQRELAEELGIRVSLENLSERLLPLGFVVDLLRLRPEACVQFEAVDGEIGRRYPRGAWPGSGQTIRLPT
jgi:8-oxo-dGTP pyrophosphatase MutT (NUDIX family)